MIPPLTIQTPPKNKASNNRQKLESLDLKVDNILPSKKIKINHDQDEDEDVTINEKDVSLVDKI